MENTILVGDFVAFVAGVVAGCIAVSLLPNMQLDSVQYSPVAYSCAVVDTVAVAALAAAEYIAAADLHIAMPFAARSPS